MGRKRILALLAFLVVILAPSVALAAGENSFVESIGGLIRGRLEESILPYLHQKGWANWQRWGVSIVCTGLTMAWMWRMWPWIFKEKAPAFYIGKVVGPFAMIGWALAIGMALVGLAIGLVKGYLTGAIMSLFHGLGWFSWLLGKIGIMGIIDALVTFAVGLAFTIGIIIFVGSQAGSIIKELFGALKGIVTGNPEGQDRMSYKLAGTAALSGLLNSPEWNNDASFLPSIVSALLGLLIVGYSFLRTKKGEMSARVRGEPLPADHPVRPNGWRCVHEIDPDKGWPYYIPKLDKSKEPEIDEATGEPIKSKFKVCQGPDDVDEDGVSYDGINPADAEECLSYTCDGKNTAWQICQNPKCGYKGEKGFGFRRKPDTPAKCKKCGKMHPRIQRKGPFHLPEDDQSNAGTVKKATTPEVTSLVAPAVPGMPGLPPGLPPQLAPYFAALQAAQAQAQTAAQPGASRALPAWAQVHPGLPLPAIDPFRVELDLDEDDVLIAGPRQYQIWSCTNCAGQIDMSKGETFCSHCGTAVHARKKALKKPETEPAPEAVKVAVIDVRPQRSLSRRRERVRVRRPHRTTGAASQLLRYKL